MADCTIRTEFVNILGDTPDKAIRVDHGTAEDCLPQLSETSVEVDGLRVESVSRTHSYLRMNLTHILVSLYGPRHIWRIGTLLFAAPNALRLRGKP